MIRAWHCMSAAVTAVLVWHGGDAVCAADFYWVGAGGEWSDTNNWAAVSGGGGGAYATPPGSADHVRFDANGTGNAVIDTHYTIGSFTADGYTGTISFPTNVAADLTVNNGFYLGGAAALVCAYSSTNGDGSGRTVTVGGDATIEGHIDADLQGFRGDPGIAEGPGGTLGDFGGTHGGRGGKNPKVAYGSLEQPASLGSGATRIGANGGGAVKLEVTGTLTVNGSITANGAVCDCHLPPSCRPRKHALRTEAGRIKNEPPSSGLRMLPGKKPRRARRQEGCCRWKTFKALRITAAYWALLPQNPVGHSATIFR